MAKLALACFVVVASAQSDGGLNATVSADECAEPKGDCGVAYQVCCAGFAAKGFPCGCHLKDGTGAAGDNCGDCGVAYKVCCEGFKLKGYPCECDVGSSGIVV